MPWPRSRQMAATYTWSRPRLSPIVAGAYLACPPGWAARSAGAGGVGGTDHDPPASPNLDGYPSCPPRRLRPAWNCSSHQWGAFPDEAEAHTARCFAMAETNRLAPRAAGHIARHQAQALAFRAH